MRRRTACGWIPACPLEPGRRVTRDGVTQEILERVDKAENIFMSALFLPATGRRIRLEEEAWGLVNYRNQRRIVLRLQLDYPETL